MKISLQRLTNAAVIGFLVFSILWKGGKTLESTWLLAALSGLCIFTYWWSEKKSKNDELGVSRLAWSAIMLFLTWSVLSYAFSSAKNYGLDEIFRDVSLFLIFLWTARQAAQPNGMTAERVLRIIGYATLAGCLLGVAVYVLQPVNRFVGSFFDYRFQTDYWPNAWAEFLLLAWPASLWTFRRWNRRLMPLAVVAFGFVLGCLFLSYSRGAVLAFAGQLGFIAFIVIAQSVMHRSANMMRFGKVVLVRGMPVIFVAVAIFFGVNLIRAQFHDVQSVASKVTFTAAEGASSATERASFWKQAIELAKQKPLFGWGPESFRFIQPHIQTDVLATADHPHNVFLKLAMERGLPAVLFFIVILLLLLVPPFWSELRRPDDDPLNARLLMLTGVVGVLLHNLIDYNLQFVGIALPLFLYIGFLQRSGSGSLPRALVRSIEVVVTMILLLVVINEGRLLLFSSLGRHAEAKGDDAQALHWYERSENEWFSRDLHLSHALLLLKDDRVADAETVLQRYLAQNPIDARGWRLQAEIDKAKNDFPQAQQDEAKALAYGKYNDLGILRSFLEILQRNDAGQIDRWKDEADRLLKAFDAALMANTHFIDLSQNPEEFEKVSQFLARRYPQDAAAYLSAAKRVMDHVQTEREKTKARPAGFLW